MKWLINIQDNPKCIYNNNSFKIHEAKINRTKEEIDKFIIRVGVFNMPLSVTDKISRQKIIKNIEDSNNTIN